MAKPANTFISRFDALIAPRGLKEGEKAYKKCRTKFFGDMMKTVDEKIASEDPAARKLEADYTKLAGHRMISRISREPALKQS
jgi:hypothetical protein